ncbi:ras-related protein rab-11a [Anaeramoeba ignava]|uniref:Ras-related protein rab-11a n=1 Tax=Anaeramoeba ignava TaxID=1746090 RepID=A0A9Q0RGI0_ANAIG|nr:ras-related protein rab-11a [Anaeramoeba ignava]
MEFEEHFDYPFKAILIGNSAVGKTNILSRFHKNEFSLNTQTTIGVEFGSRILEIKGKKIQLKVWDTAGQEIFRSITQSYYRGSNGAFIVYDITNEDSFNELENWIVEFQKNAQESAVPMIIGNKCDLEKDRKIPKEKGEKFAKKNKALFMETSAKDGTNIEEVFQMLATEILNVFENKQQKKDNININNPHSEKRRSCC